MKRLKPLTRTERAELIARLETLKALGHVWTLPGRPSEWMGKSSDGTTVSLGWFNPDQTCPASARPLYNYLKARPTPDKW